MNTASYAGKNGGVWWGIFKEYLKQNIIASILKKANAHKKINVNKNRSKKKNWFKLLCLWGFSNKKSYVVHISFYTTRGWDSR